MGLVLGALTAMSADQHQASQPLAAILAYHRFGAVVSDSMTVRTSTFRWQLQYLREHHYSVVPLRAVINRLHGTGASLPTRTVVITVDDGHRSVFTDMLPLVRELDVPVTLFIYPSAISNAPYAMTWEQLAELSGSGLFEIQSHTYWHPNFKVEKRRLVPAAYRDFALLQLTRPRDLISQKLAQPAEVIAWPFGIYDDELLRIAMQSGYIAGVTLDRRLVTEGDQPMALPRLLVTDGASGSAFAAMLPPEAR
ncbi:MAG TPA: polysaccharide deacetylase family protein [Vicinamibacterales bacterium]|nr:polysaccharide deacetylase family protein [Vicinamibacterales bacterium]